VFRTGKLKCELRTFSLDASGDTEVDMFWRELAVPRLRLNHLDASRPLKRAESQRVLSSSLMMLTKRLWLLMLFVWAPLTAYGDTEARRIPYAMVATGGKYIFVMFAPDHASDEHVRLVEGEQILRYISATKYPASGLYLNDGSNTPLWTVDWYAHSVIVPSDGIHLVRRGPWARRLADEAFTFYANGKELRSYRISELADTVIPLSRTVSHFEWEESAVVDEPHHTLAVTTLSKERFLFDYTTGEMLSARRPLRAGVFGGAIALIFIVTWLIRRRRAH
jgi:hypothetical protein